MARITPEQRREALRRRTKKGVNERGQKGLGRKSVLDFSKAGDLKISKYEIKSGKETNYIDILPFEITEKWYKNLRSVSGSPIGLDVGFTDYKLEIPIHRNVGENNDIFLCLRQAFGKKCPLCEEMFDEYNKNEADQDDKKIDALKPKWRCFYNIYDYDGNSEEIQLWEDISYYLFEESLQEAMETEDDGIVTFSDLEMGSSISFKGRDKKLGKNSFVEAHSISFKEREVYEESILDKTFPLDKMLVIPTYEQIAKAHLGMDEDNESEVENEPVEDEESEEKTEKTKSRSRKRFKDDENEHATESQEENPFHTCPAGREFGVDCDPADQNCENCEEDIFQACADAQDNNHTEEVKEEKTKSRSRKRVKNESENKDEQEKKTTSRRRRGRK